MSSVRWPSSRKRIMRADLGIIRVPHPSGCCLGGIGITMSAAPQERHTAARHVSAGEDEDSDHAPKGRNRHRAYFTLNTTLLVNVPVGVVT